MPKKLTKLQKIKQKAYQNGVSSQTPATKYWMDMYNEVLKQRQNTESQLAVANAKVASLSAILQSIHTSAQVGADILRVKIMTTKEELVASHEAMARSGRPANS